MIIKEEIMLSCNRRNLYRDVVFGGRAVAVGPAEYRKVVFGASAEAPSNLTRSQVYVTMWRTTALWFSCE